MRNAAYWFLFLPPNSPDLNSIEMAFSKLKAHLGSIGANTFTNFYCALAEICGLYSQEECWNCFHVVGYVSSQQLDDSGWRQHGLAAGEKGSGCFDLDQHVP